MVDTILPVKCCRASYLYNLLQDYPDKVIILDTRSQEAFDDKSFENAIHINEEFYKFIWNESNPNETSSGEKKLHESELTFPKFQSALPEDWKARIQNCKRSFCVIVCNVKDSLLDFFLKKYPDIDNTYTDKFQTDSDILKTGVNQIFSSPHPDSSSIDIGITLYRMLMEHKVRELYLMVDGSNKFFQSYHFMDRRQQKMLEATIPRSIRFPNDIMGRRLFLGNGAQATNQTLLKELNVTHIMNCTEEISNKFEGNGFDYLKIAIKDCDGVTIAKNFGKAYEYIDNTFNANPDNVLFIHCVKGMSRSASMIIMYLMKKFNWSCEKAMTYVKDRRAIVNPDERFKAQLEKFQDNQYKFEEEILNT